MIPHLNFLCMQRKKPCGCVARGVAILGVQQYASGCDPTCALPQGFFLDMGSAEEFTPLGWRLGGLKEGLLSQTFRVRALINSVISSQTKFNDLEGGLSDSVMV